MAYDMYFIEACVGFSGTEDWRSDAFQDAIVVLEGKNTEKSEYLAGMLKDIEKWSASAKNRNHEIYDSAGDITKIEPNLSDVMTALLGNERGNETFDGDKPVIDLRSGGAKTAGKVRKARALYTHFVMHKSLYVNAFKTNNTTVKTVYVAGTWLIISYLSALCTFMLDIARLKQDPDLKYGRMMEDLRKIISHPKYVEYMGVAENTGFNTESILYEGALAIGATLVSMIVALRLIVWNIYTMRTKLSDKLRVSAEFLEKNASRLKNTNKNDKDKIAAKQLKAAGLLNKVADKVRIKMDDDQVTTPPVPKKPDKPSPSSSAADDDDDDDDIEL